jgi:hypothetical protein
MVLASKRGWLAGGSWVIAWSFSGNSAYVGTACRKSAAKIQNKFDICKFSALQNSFFCHFTQGVLCAVSYLATFKRLFLWARGSPFSFGVFSCIRPILADRKRRYGIVAVLFTAVFRSISSLSPASHAGLHFVSCAAHTCPRPLCTLSFIFVYCFECF